MFEAIIWGGAVLSVIGLIGLIWCIVRVMQARRAQLDDEAMRAVLARVLPMNMGALFISVIGLMCVVIGVLLG